MIELKEISDDITDHDPDLCVICEEPARPTHDSPGFYFQSKAGKVCAQCAATTGFKVDPDLLGRILRAYHQRRAE